MVIHSQQRKHEAGQDDIEGKKERKREKECYPMQRFQLRRRRVWVSVGLAEIKCAGGTKKSHRHRHRHRSNKRG